MRLEGHIEIEICKDTKIKIELGNVGELLEIGILGEPGGRLGEPLGREDAAAPLLTE